MNGISSVLKGINYLENEPMSRHTTFRIGGPADYFVCPKNTGELERALSVSCDKIIIGNGSNLLFPDEGYRGMVIKYSDCSIEACDDDIICGAGALMSKVSAVAYENSLTGFEFASGIPGSMGGAVRMNAGAYGGSMSDVVQETEVFDKRSGKLFFVSDEEHKFSYRHSIFCDNEDFVITKIKIRLKKGDRQEIKAVIDDFTNRRTTKQPLKYPSAGSVFKRPEGYFAGALIEQSGLKGYSVGGAQVSELHAGFIINTGNATARDVKKLIEHIKETVYKDSGVTLQCEVCIL